MQATNPDEEATLARSSALSGLRIVDLSTIAAAPSCSQTLGDLGADVIKVEPPGGDDTRRLGTVIAGQSTQFRGTNRNKRGISLDLTRVQGQEVLLRMLEGADILLENFKTGTLERWGLGYEDVLAHRFPRLIHCRVTGFGATGPYGGFPGYDGIAQALGGVLSLNGEADGAPVRNCVPMCDLATGMYATVGILMALHEREKSGFGQSVEVALLDAGVSLLYPYAQNRLLDGPPGGYARMGNHHPAVAPHDSFATRDGHVMLAVFDDAQFAACCEVLGAPDLAGDPRFASNALRVTHCDALTECLSPLFAARTRMDVSAALLRAGVAAGPVLQLPETFAHPHIAHRRMIVEDAPGLRAVGSPIKLSRTPTTERRPSPHFGEHLEEVLTEAGLAPDEITRLLADQVVFDKPRPAPTSPAAQEAPADRRPSSTPAARPPVGGDALAGVRVIDLSDHISGPLLGQILGDHGAEVIKVEPASGDPARQLGMRDAVGGSAFFSGVNRNKRGILLDLADDPGRLALTRLLESADVVIDGAVSVLAKAGLDDDTLRARFPRLISCCISGFGSSGPLGGLPASDAVVGAFAGVMSLNGAPDGAPLRTGVFAAEICAAMTAAIGVLAALHERRRSGTGQTVDIAVLDTLLSMFYPACADWLLAGKVSPRRGSTHANLSPHDVYRTGNGYVFTSLVNPRHFTQFCHEIGAPALAEDARFRTNADRLANVVALREAVEVALADKDSLEVAEELLAKSIPFGAVLSVPEVLAHAQVRHRAMVIEAEDYVGLGFPIKMSRTPARLNQIPPRLGEHTDLVLAEMLAPTAETA